MCPGPLGKSEALPSPRFRGREAAAKGQPSPRFRGRETAAKGQPSPSGCEIVNGH